jgi:hypothetical protein
VNNRQANNKDVTVFMEDIMKTACLRYFVSCAIFTAALAGQPAQAAPVISELFYDAGGGDAGLVFVELFGFPGESLDGLVLEGINGVNGDVYSSFALSGVMPGDGVLVIGDDSGGSTSVANADLIGDIDYQNGPDSVVLRGLSGVLDAVGYGVFGATDIFAGEGFAAPDPSAGSSIARLNALLDTGDNSIDFSVLDTPTPGSVPFVSAVPLPASAWLLGSGLMTLVSLRRNR